MKPKRPQSRQINAHAWLLKHAIGQVAMSGAVLGILLGCDSQPSKVPVHGIVRYRGEPLSFGSIMFQPAGAGPLARSRVSKDGTFQLVSDDGDQGVEAGTCSVRVTAFELQERAAAGAREQEPSLGKSAIPRKYQNFGTSGITIAVQPDMSLPISIELE